MHNVYETPLNTRYASTEMKTIFSPDKKFKTWRRLWVALAEAQMQLGLPITQQQIDELKSNQDTINYEEAQKQEKIVRHDVMAHVHAYGVLCPNAKPIIHLGATSCYVGDNTDLLLMREAMHLIRKKVLSVMAKLAAFAWDTKEMPTLGFTHFQPAQLTTIGKRASLWLHDLLLDLEEIDDVLSHLKFLGSKGTTGTQASFMALFDQDSDKVKQLDSLIALKFNFDSVYPVSGQTYSRKIDDRFMHVLASIAQSSAKFSNDLRLLQHLKEIEEPYEKEQIGSSAMAYKRNPMRCERIAGLCRYIIANAQNTAMTASAQWFERTLDDSSNKRIAVPEAFLAADAVLNIYLNVVSGLVVYPKMVQKHIALELPFMATENILMDAVKKGGDRQELHERIRLHSAEASKKVKEEGQENDLLERIAKDPAFGLTHTELNETISAKKYIGRAPQQTEEFLLSIINPLIAANKQSLIDAAEMTV